MPSTGDSLLWETQGERHQTLLVAIKLLPSLRLCHFPFILIRSLFSPMSVYFVYTTQYCVELWQKQPTGLPPAQTACEESGAPAYLVRPLLGRRQ